MFEYLCVFTWKSNCLDIRANWGIGVQFVPVCAGSFIFTSTFFVFLSASFSLSGVWIFRTRVQMYTLLLIVTPHYYYRLILVKTVVNISKNWQKVEKVREKCSKNTRKHWPQLCVCYGILEHMYNIIVYCIRCINTHWRCMCASVWYSNMLFKQKLWARCINV